MIVKAQLPYTREKVLVEYVGYDQTGCSIYREICTGKEYYDIELDFDCNNSPSIALSVLNFVRSLWK